MPGTLLSYHGPATHRDARDDEVLRAWQPKSAILMNEDWGSTDRLSWLYTNLPNTVFLYRNWPQSEEFDDMFNNPIPTGKRHADEWASRVHSGRDGSSAWKTLPGFNIQNHVFLGVNEPTLYGARFEANKAQVAAYYVSFLDTLRGHGLLGGALSLGVGWPNNSGTDTRVRWEPFETVRQAIVRGGHYLILHEYWDLQGPTQNLGWWFGRFKQCPWDVKIILGELGVDRGVQGPTWEGTRGFSGHMGAERYIQELGWADRYLRADRRIHSANVFTYDYNNNQWHSFGIQGIREQFLGYVVSQRNTPNPAPTPFPLYPPNVIDPLPPTGGTTPPPPPTIPAALRDLLLAEAERRLVLRFNPNAALQRVIFGGDFDQFTPNSPEFFVTYEGRAYLGQRAENGRGAVRVYYCPSGEWGNVRYVERAA